MATINFDKTNERIKNWGVTRAQKLKSTATSLGIQHREGSPSPSSSIAKISSRLRMREGLVSAVVFRFPRSLIWVHKGAGKGMGGSKGSRWINKYGNTRSTDPDSFGKMGTGSRKPKPWFNLVMDAPDGVDNLATIVAEETGDAIVNNLFIK